MAEEVVAGKREPIGQHGKPLRGGTSLQDSIQIICIIPQGSMSLVSNEDIRTIGDLAIPRV